MFLGLFIFFIFLVSFYIKKGDKAQKAADEAFWQRENDANNTRRQDISGLPYITIPLEKFPIGIADNSDLQECERTLTELSSQKILNLGTQTNTDLKLKYGPANLEILSAYDQNFAALCTVLVSYAKCLLSLNYTSEAQSVLEYGIECGSDHSQNYRLLAELYSRQNRRDLLDSLLTHARELDSPMKQSIITHLESLL